MDIINMVILVKVISWLNEYITVKFNAVKKIAIFLNFFLNVTILIAANKKRHIMAPNPKTKNDIWIYANQALFKDFKYAILGEIVSITCHNEKK